MGQVLTCLTIVAVSHDGSSTKVALSCAGSAQIDLAHPFTGKQEDLLTWYLQDYALKEPFEVTKAEHVEASLSQYGRSLASQIWNADVIPSGSSLKIHVQLGLDPSDAPSIALQALRWEILEDISYWPSDSRIKQVAVKRVLPRPIEAPSPIPRNPSTVLNVLMVVARPDHDADANHRLISRPFMKAISRLPQGQGAVIVKPFFVRPATWEKFLEVLREPEVGYYQLVHFDMHGKVKKVDGEYSAFLDFVEFSNNSKSKVVKDRIGASSVAEALVESGVQVVILNACESAKADSEVSGGGNLAETFVRAGVPTVVAMSYQILDTAAEIFMESLYDSLLVKNHDISSAICNARTALADQPIRKGRFSHPVKLLDTVVPVLYQSEDSFFQLPQEQSMPGGSPSELVSRFPSEENDDDMLGRDINILDLELLLVQRKSLLLHGPGGCGKTTFIKYICWWWKMTGFVEDYIYFDLSTMRFTLDTVLAEIAKTLLPHRTSLEQTATEQNIIKLLINRRYLLIFDSFEVTTTNVWQDMRGVPEAQRERMKSFLKRIEGGNTSVLISSRMLECWLTTPSAEEMYALGGLPVQSAMQLADRVARVNHKDRSIYANSRESLEFLQRVIILLEGNPLAIETLFSAAKQTGVTPMSLYYSILAGDVTLQPGLHMRHRFFDTISGMLMQMNIRREQMSGLDSGVSLIFAEPFLAAFWGVFPEDMRVFYYFILLKFWVSDVELPPERVGQRSAKWLESVHRKLAEFKFGHYFPAVLRELEGAALIEPAIVTTNAGNEASYHIHPLVTLLIRKNLTGPGPEIARHAMVEFLIFKNMQYKESACAKSVSWGHPTVVQNMHFCYVNILAAIGTALESDLKAEVEWHGMDFVYGLSLPLTEILWFQLEIGTVLKPYYKRHLNRFLALKPSWRNGIPPAWDLGQILQMTLYLGKLVDDTFKKLLPVCLRMADEFKAAGRKMQSWTETSWFELRLQEGLVALDEGRTEKAQEIFERNLRDDPSEDNDLTPAIRRLQMQNLQNWTGLLLEKNLPTSVTDATGVSPPPKKLHSRRLLDSLLDPEQVEQLKTMPVGSGYSSLLESHQDVVATFGRLTKAILAEPIDNSYQDITPKGVFEPESRKTLTSSFSGAEKTIGFVSDVMEADLRSRVGYTKDAVRLLERLLQKQTDDDWRSEAEIHRRLHCIAFNQGDMKKAIAHLDVQRELAERESDHEMRCNLFLRYAECHDQLGESVSALKYVAKAAQVAEMYDEELIKQVVAAAHDIKAMEMYVEKSQSRFEQPIMDGLTHKEHVLLKEVTEFIRLLSGLNEQLKGLQTQMAIYDSTVGTGLSQNPA